jgi:hypothetical protein
MKTLHAVIRIEKLTGKPAIFYRNPVKYNGQALSIYTREEQHCEGCVSYYREKTRPASSEDERKACAVLVAHYTAYCAHYGDEQLVIHARLRNN